MKTKLILMLCTLISLNGLAQSNKVEKDDHLYPVRGYIDEYETTATCYTKIRTVLFKGLKERPQVRYFECPSFYEESMFQIENDNPNNTYEIVARQPEKRIWSVKDLSSIKVRTWRNSLSKDDAEAIITLFRRALAGTCFVEVSFDPQNHDISDLVLDDDAYFFSCLEPRTYEFRSGMTKSSVNGPKMVKLKEIASKINFQWARSDKGTLVLPDELKTAIVNLTNELKNSAR